MSRARLILPSRLVLVLVALAVAVSLSLTAAVASADYPPEVRRAFTKSCVKAAINDGAPRSDAKTVCRVALRCIEDKLTLNQLIRLERSGKLNSSPKVRSCVRKAAAAIS